MYSRLLTPYTYETRIKVITSFVRMTSTMQIQELEHEFHEDTKNFTS